MKETSETPVAKRDISASICLDACLADYENRPIQPGTKGIALSQPIRQRDLKSRNFNLLDAQTGFPAAILKRSALSRNAQWMRAYCEMLGVRLAPHGKTTMSPQLFALQLAAGAWGITFATAAQVLTAYRLGVRRMLLANQLVACAEIEALLTVWNSDPDFDIYIVVDSPFGVERLCKKVIELGSARRLPVLIEMGLPGGRAGCRDPASALDLAYTIAASAALSLAGVEGYEGLLMSTDREIDLAQVDAFLAQLMAVAQDIDSRRLFSEPEIILSAGGTAYFDRVADAFGGRSEFSRPLIPILRSGCYLTHDHGFYNRLLDEMERRQPKLFAQLPAGGLKPALEVWSIVQSRPEPTLAILTMGKRDASYDIDLPRPLWHHAPYAACSQAPPLPPRALPGDCRIEKMNDQHAYMRVPDSLVSQIGVGDLIGCGISHPCTTFDKWSTLLEVDDEYRVVGVVNTEF